MMGALRLLRLIVVGVSIASVVAVSAGSIGNAQQTSTPADDASRFTGKSSSLDATGLRTTRRHFEAGARSAWHSHDRGQLIFVEEGRGRVQRRGERIQDLGPGDSDYTRPGVQHWHGAAPDRSLVQAALSFGGETRWMELVTDAEYFGKGK